MPVNSTIHFRVAGRVQGVFFRAATQRQAQQLGLAGWVRNLPDGCVEGMASGEPGRLKRLQDWLRDGPPHARVTELTVEEIPSQDFDGFHIR